MLNIQQCIENIPPLRVVFTNDSHQYTYAEVTQLQISNMDTIQELKGSAVVINGRERLEFALLLSLLDSHVTKVLFLPQDIDKELHEKYYQEAKINYEVYLENNSLKYNTVNSLNKKQDKGSTYKTEWIIPTSGTTNIPKLVSHSFESLTKSTKFNIELGEDFRWGLVFDIYRFSGIQVFLQSILAGSTLIITSPMQSMGEILNLLVEKKCNALSATPSFWRKVLMTKESNKLQLKRITLGGEISDNNILQALNKKYPNAKISHIYASTEVGVGFSVRDGKEGFPKTYLDGALDSIRMKIDPKGLLWIAPENQGQKYLSCAKMYDNDGYINTGDIVELRYDRVNFLGRDSGAINVGGNKVQPEEVEARLLSSGLLSAVYVYAMKNSMMGSLVCADVVLLDSASDKKEVKTQILKYCRENLEGFKVPAIIKFVNELKTTQSGKLKRTSK
jgi:acyl-CoA synthetase (AMP-forming)/AMP-acid ligase II